MLVLTEPQRTAVAAGMRAIIADISEHHWSAGWYSGIEDILWGEIQQPKQEWHGHSQDGDLLPVLRELSLLCDGWVDCERGYVPRVEWEAAHKSGKKAANSG